MSLEIVTVWYNEAFLAPFFLRHYAYAEKITLFYDEDTTDDTLSIVKAYPQVRIIPFRFPDMFDSTLKQEMINEQYRRSDQDYVMSVDADEFVFFKEGDRIENDVRLFIRQHPECDVFVAGLFQVYRNARDADLDPELPAVPQRRYGDPNRTEGLNAMYNKPVLLRAGLDCAWEIGCHSLTSHNAPLHACPEQLLGSHWAMADPCFAVERRIKNRRERRSRRNIENVHSYHQQHITAQSLIQDIASHVFDPLLF